MRDQPLSLTEAAKWLGCTVEEIGDYLTDGRLRSYAGADGQVSLNSVVVLAESLPAERGVFRVRDMPSYDSAPPRPSSGGYGSGPGGGFNKPRPAPVVERRPLRPPPRGE